MISYDHRDRVRMEKVALDERIERLRAFVHNTIFPTLCREEQSLLIVQLATMIHLSELMRDRIALWARQAATTL